MRPLAELSPARALAEIEGARLWCADLDQPARVIGPMLAMLSPAERERAAALRGAPARRRFVVGRSTLRMILGELTGTPPGQVQFSYGPDGKPALALPDANVAPQFNVSHSRDLALVVVADNRRVGVDVEWTGGSSPIESVARRYLSAAERSLLEAAPDADRRRLFFRIWVRKEAYLKGRGEGISQWIYETNFSSPEPGSGVVPERPVRDQDNWVVRDLAGLPSGFVASVALSRRAS